MWKRQVGLCVYLSSFEWGRPTIHVLEICRTTNPITQLSDAKSPLMALHVPELRMMMLANESSADIPYWNQWPLRFRVAPWLCGLMDSVLSVEGSQIYRQSAFNKKQVACKVHCRATKDVNASETAGIRIEMLLVAGRVAYFSDAHFTLNHI